MACAPLFKSETITLTQYGEKEVTISQTSPYEDTIITNSRPREMVRYVEAIKKLLDTLNRIDMFILAWKSNSTNSSINYL